MPNKLASLRHRAYISQCGHCYYCGFLMWESDPAQFARTHSLLLPQILRFQCTAEHLEARQDGGQDKASNIVAACIHCNQSRHRMKPAPSAELYRRVICKQLAKGNWHKQKVTNKVPRAMSPTLRHQAH